MVDSRLEILLAGRDVSEKAFNAVRGHIARVTKAAFSLQGALGLAAGATGMGLLIKKSLDSADAIGKAADVMGIGTGALQEYRHAAELAGVSNELLDNSLIAFTKRLGEARQGSGALVTYLKKTDEQFLKQVQSTGSVEEALQLVFKRMGDTADASDRAALAAAAFSRSGVKLTNIVKDGAEGLEAMRQEARDLGLVIDDSLIRDSEKANDQLSKLATTLKVNVTSAVVSLAPVIIKISDNMLSWIKQNQELIKQDIPSFIGRIGTTVATVVTGIQKLDKLLDSTIGGKLSKSVSQTYIDSLEKQKIFLSGEISRLKYLGSQETEYYKKLQQRLELTKRLIAVAESEQKHRTGRRTYYDDYSRAAGVVTGYEGRKPPSGGGGESFPTLAGLRDIPTPESFGKLLELDDDVRDILEEVARYRKEFQNEVEKYTGDLIPQSVIEAQLTRMEQAHEKNAEKIKTIWSDVSDNMQDSLVDFVTSGKLSFSDLAQSIVKDILRIQARAFASGIFGSAGIGAVGESIANLFTGGGSLPTTIRGGQGGGYGFNNGGFIGEKVFGVGVKSGSSYEFDPNEVVIPTRKMGGQAGGVSIVINNTSGTPATVRENRTADNIREIIIDIGAADIAGRGPMARTLETVYGINRVGGLL